MFVGAGVATLLGLGVLKSILDHTTEIKKSKPSRRYYDDDSPASE